MIVSEWENEAQLEDKRHVAMTFGIKCADLGHSAKAIKIHTKWSELVQLEFFI